MSNSNLAPKFTISNFLIGFHCIFLIFYTLYPVNSSCNIVIHGRHRKKKSASGLRNINLQYRQRAKKNPGDFLILYCLTNFQISCLFSGFRRTLLPNAIGKKNRSGDFEKKTTRKLEITPNSRI